MMQVYYTTTRTSDFNLLHESCPESVLVAAQWLLYKGADTYPISLLKHDQEHIARFLRSKGILAQDSVLKSWASSKLTQTVTLDYSSGQTISFRGVPPLDTQTGAKNTVSNIAFVPSPLIGSVSGKKPNNPISPSHYQNSKGYDIIEFTEDLPFNRGNAIKYLYRAGKKNKDKELEDLEKAKWYIERELARVRRERKEVGQPVPEAGAGSKQLVQGPINQGGSGDYIQKQGSIAGVQRLSEQAQGFSGTIGGQNPETKSYYPW